MSWRERIAAARAQGAFSEDDSVAAGDYTTCAVGEQVKASGGVLSWQAFSVEPKSEHCDGMRFMRAVHGNDFDAADMLLDAIEDRALELKRQA